MTRPLRLEFPGAVYHLTARGDRRGDIFLGDADRLTFLDLLAKEVRQQHWRLYAYCLLGNHYHLLIETPEGNLVDGMRRLNGVYTQTFNRRHDRVGHVLQGRYKSILVDKDAYLLELSRYIVLNPLRAGMVQRIEDWPWSSYAVTAGKRAAPDWLDAEWIVMQFGTDPMAARAAYRRFVRAGKDRASPWDALRSQIYLGEDEFLERMEKIVSEQDRQGIPASHRLPARPKMEGVLKTVASMFGVTVRNVKNRSHQRAFQIWVYLLRRAVNLSLREVAEVTGVSAGRISQIQRAIEEGEQEPVLVELKNMYKVKA